jgi:chorismate-pyruvate lyase
MEAAAGRYGLNARQRVLLATAGTLQETLSAFFGGPVTVEVVHQEETPLGLVREVDLVFAARQLVVCHAITEARIAHPEIRRLLLEGELGIGQISAALGLVASFALDDAGHGEGIFWRAYRLWGDGFSYRIRETFPAQLYEKGHDS